MITEEQWLSLHAYVTKRLETEERFSLNDFTLQEMFSITHPFWDEMCKFAAGTERAYTGNKHFITQDGEPSEIVYARPPSLCSDSAI